MCQYIEVYACMHMYMSDDNADLCTDIISAALVQSCCSKVSNTNCPDIEKITILSPVLNQ